VRLDKGRRIEATTTYHYNLQPSTRRFAPRPQPNPFRDSLCSSQESLFGLFKNLFKSSDGTTNIWDRYIFGRDQSTGYTQLLTRIESDLYESLPEVFNMVTRMAWGMDDLYWLKFPSANKMNKVQIELIDYNTNAIGKEATFNEHVDNYSVVSMIVMLSDTKDFKGGENFFRVNGTLPCFGSDPSAETMTLKLEKGDAIFFRGEVLGEAKRGARSEGQLERMTGGAKRRQKQHNIYPYN